MRPLPEAFCVLATQNPLNDAGTFPLSAGQRDRFSVVVSLGLPAREAERAVVLGQGGMAALPQLQAVARTDQFVAALYFQGSQLLVVAAKYSTPDRLNYLIGQKQYKDVYSDLSSASEQTTKVFVMDLGANGLKFKRENNEPFDTVDS